jgi:Domain of Unknown Function (DUF928)
MTRTKPKFNFATAAIGLPALWVAIAGWTVPTRAELGAKALTHSPTSVWEVSLFAPPGDRGAPTTVGGATRGEGLCHQVTPLVPKDNTKVETTHDNLTPPPYFGLTVAAQPTFVWHFKQSPLYAGEPIAFVLYEYNPDVEFNPDAGKYGKQVYETTIDYPDQSGARAFNLPFDLEVGKSYVWYLEMGCDDGQSGSTYGWIERIEEPSQLSSQLSAASGALAKTQVYAKSGVWFDALDTLVRERMTADSPALQDLWMQLLQDIDKSELVDTPLIPSQSPESSSEPASDRSSGTIN